MNQNRWTSPMNSALIVGLAALTAATVSVRAQSAPGVDPATLAKYDANKNGVLDPTEVAAMEADAGRSTTTSSSTSAQGDIIQLSPFQVDASKDKGYFAENTLAGSRMKTNISDLGASISVITKQQLEDTASIDINDVFRYEINTEGSSTYTPAVQAFRSDGLLDVNAGGTQGNSVSSFTNANANRVRGLGTPSSAINYYPSIGSLPVDSYNVESLEISRGPNSMLFGMGSPAGIVNTTPTKAALNRSTNTVATRFDDRGSYRASLSFNRGLIQDKLAIYGAMLYDNREFTRKPSYDRTRRQYGSVTIKPFEKTVIRAFVEGYNNDNRRPNTITPRDFVTPWNLAGQPVYDPVTKRVTRLATGEVSGPFIMNASSPRANEVRQWIMSRPNYNPTLRNVQNDATFTQYNGVNIFGDAALNNTASIQFVPGMNWITGSRSVQQIQNGQLANWFQDPFNSRYRTTWGVAGNPSGNAPVQPDPESSIWANPTWADVYNRHYTRSEALPITDRTLARNRVPGVTDKSIYDYEEINLAQMSFGKERATSYNIEIEQEITRDLFFNGGWFRQDYDQMTNYTVGQLNATALYVDTNRNLPDGTPNPFLGLPFVTDFDPDRYMNNAIEDHFRGMLAYTPDFTRNSGWMRWLGRHQILGLWSRDESKTTAYRQRLNYLAAGNQAAAYRYLPNPNLNAQGQETGWNFQGGGSQNASMQRFFYLANPGDPMGRVTRSSGEFNPLRYSGEIDAYNYAASRFESFPVTVGFNTFDSPGRSQRHLQSLSAGMTNYLWNERLITTFGVREDRFKARNVTTGALTDVNGVQIAPALTSPQKWVNGLFQDEVVLNRWANWVHLKGTTRTQGGVLRLFRGWEAIDSRANSGNLFWQFVRDFGVSYNESDNFNAPPSAQVDATGTPLPKPTGEGKDYGFQFSLFDNKLFARVTWFEASNKEERTSPGTTIGRLTGNIDTTLFRNWARTIVMINMGMDPTSDQFGVGLTQAQEDQIQAAAATIWKLPYNYYNDVGNIGATRDADAEGIEANLNYNPARNWTLRFTFGKQETRYSNVLKQFDQWYGIRYPVWTAAKAADYLLPQYRSLQTYTTSGGRQVDLTNFWTSYGFNSNVRLDDPFGNTNVSRYYDINVQPQYALARDLNGQVAPNQRKYRWSLLTDYGFERGMLKGVGVGGSARWESRSVMGYYGRATGADANNPGLLDVSDITRPIYDSDNLYIDLWFKYQRKILDDRVTMKLQLNVVNAFENGGLQATQVNYDGTPYAFRIVDPRQFILTASFQF